MLFEGLRNLLFRGAGLVARNARTGLKEASVAATKAGTKVGRGTLAGVGLQRGVAGAMLKMSGMGNTMFGATLGAASGGLYGAMSEDTSVLGGMLAGAGIGAGIGRYGHKMDKIYGGLRGMGYSRGMATKSAARGALTSTVEGKAARALWRHPVLAGAAIGGVTGAVSEDSTAWNGMLAGAGIGAGIAGGRAMIGKGAKKFSGIYRGLTGMGYSGPRAAGVAIKAAYSKKQLMGAAALGIGGAGAYYGLRQDPERQRMVVGQDANAMLAMERGTSTGVVSPAFERSAQGLVQGLHQGRHS